MASLASGATGGGASAPTPLNIIATGPKSRHRNPLRGSTPDAKIMRRMKAAGKSPRDPRRPIGGNTRSPQVGVGGVRRYGAKETSPGPGNPRLNLRRSVRVGAWNVLSLQDDARVPALSAELARLGIAVAALSEVRRPGNGEISVGGYTYFWSGRADGRHTEGVAVAVSDRLISQVKEVTPVSERVMRLRLANTLG